MATPNKSIVNASATSGEVVAGTEFGAVAEASNRPPLWWLLGVIVLAIAIRAWIVAVPGIGHMPDLLLFDRWIRGLAEHGLPEFYKNEKFCDYPPLMVLAFQAIAAVCGGKPSDVALQAAVKSLACFADLAIGLLLCVGGRRWLGRRGGAVAATLYLLNPVSIYNSAYWGQLDSVYTAIALAALLAVGRRWWMAAGFLAAASVAAKFQAVTFVPLFLLECYRVGRWSGLLRKLCGAWAAAAFILAPFAMAGVLGTVLQRSYLRVVGQYDELSKSAFNIWYLTGDAGAVDWMPPQAITQIVANGRASFDLYESWLMGLSCRRLSLALFALSVAVTLSLYSLRPGGMRWAAAAGTMSLCFFLFPTEMHERYAFPALAFLALWAASAVTNERVYWLLSGLLLLNLAAFTPPAPIGPQIAAGILLVFVLLLVGLLRDGTRQVAVPSEAIDVGEPPAGTRAPSLIRVFRGATMVGVVGGLALVGGLAFAWSRAPVVATDRRTVWLSSLTPKEAKQGYKTLMLDREVDGGWLRFGDTVYMRGLGTHAAAKLVYEIPPEAEIFEALVGIDASTGTQGSALLRIELDDEPAYSSDRLLGKAAAVTARIRVRGHKVMTLIVDPIEDNKSDHVDLALARFELAGPKIAE